MGMHDRLLDRQSEYGFTTFGDNYVCAQCINENVLQTYIKENACSTYCDYCGRNNEEGSWIAADIDEVMEFIIDHIKYEWGNPDDEGVGYDSREGGYLGVSVYDGWDFSEDVLCDEAEIENSDLIEDIREKLMDTMWCEIDPYGLSKGEELSFSWRAFSNLVKYETRYVFYKVTDSNADDSFINPYEIIDFIGSMVADIGLIKNIPSKEIFYRVRVSSDGEFFYSSKKIGTPPREYAINSNRMSPAGIPMFYGAAEKETALKEVDYNPRKDVVASIGEFKNNRDLTILDLTLLPKVPSIFNEDEREKRHVIHFFYNFLDDFTKPISKDGKEHVDYVPTQIVTEYFRHIFKTEKCESLDGIRFKSSRDGKQSYVLFFENKDFGEQDGNSTACEMILTKVSHLTS
ncbi:HEPN-associated N-terminal domain-containing protein [Salimicrobium flavidum]|uniref:RES domain-containing protein n=1 Tax=Salimicrobium flavidum TaxID=570947 RepID=A0A1N7J2T3_9BACI|nr:HEPN-associated N-terminal domain-containing protein [Salimicrobium flavidum]SIS43547.1 RES domain-containing protein [Salimicrobium flavidum]